MADATETKSQTPPTIAPNQQQTPASKPAAKVTPPPKNVRSHTLPLLLLALLTTFITGMMYTVSPLNYRVGNVLPTKPTLFLNPTETPTPPSNAITIKTQQTAYINQRLDYSLNYPTSWNHAEYSRKFAYIEKADGTAFIPGSETSVPDGNNALVSIEAENNNNNLSLDEYLSKYIFCNEAQATHCTVKTYGQPITIGGLQGEIASISGSTPTQLAVVANNNKIYSFRLMMNAYKKMYNTNQRQQLFNGILSSFQFIDEPTPTPNDTGIVGKITVKVCNQDDDQYNPPGTTPTPCIRPYVASVIIKSEDGSRDLGQYISNSQGLFSLNVPVGNYIVQPVPGPAPTGVDGVSLPVSAPFQKVTVLNHKMSPVFINYIKSF
jgi:hypothetical protein